MVPWYIKNDQVTAPVLVYLDFTKAFILEMNASFWDLRAVLSKQGNDGKPCVIAYASRSLWSFP